MSISRGKQFEEQFKKNWEHQFPGSFILRVPDQQSGYKGTSRNLCDFICYKDGILYLLELKSCAGNTFSLPSLSQYDRLVPKVGLQGVRVGILLWMIDHDKVLYIPIRTVTQLIYEEKKSININKLTSNYRYIDIPSTKIRVLLNSDYSVLSQLQEGD